MRKIMLVEKPTGIPSALEICKIITTFYKEGYDCPVSVAKGLWERVQVNGELPFDWWSRIQPFWSPVNVSN